MSLWAQILVGIGVFAAIYGALKIIGVARRLWPDSKGLTVDDESIVYGETRFEQPLEIPLASMELFHSIIPGVFFFEKSLDVEMLKKGLAQCLDEAPIFR